MSESPLDYESPDEQREAAAEAWRRRRFGVASLAIACVTVVASGGLILFTIANPRVVGDRTAYAFFVTFDVMLFLGLAAGVLGTDFDRERRLAYAGLFINLGLLVVGCLMTSVIGLLVR